MRRLLVEMKPDRLEDLIAANALFRPGPMDLIPDYNRRKHGTDVVPGPRDRRSLHRRDVRRDGVPGTGHADRAWPGRHQAPRRLHAHQEHQQEEVRQDRERTPQVRRGRAEAGADQGKAEELFELILKFAGYGFNKSHSTGYAIVAYQTAYLKTYFPASTWPRS
jgi:DNA polymerase-3 subunit alpha